jgi:glycosyltransferase involved in cell wall biosynthesis
MKKKVLFLTAFVPNAAAAAEKNSMIMIKELSEYFDIDVVYFKYKDQKDYVPEAGNIRVLRVIENNTILKMVDAILYPIYHPMFTIRYNYILKNWLQKQVKKNEYAAIVYEHNQMFIYAKKLKTNAVNILYAYDIMAQRIGRSSNKLMAKFCKYSEKASFDVDNSYLFTVSKKDSELVNQIYHLDSRYALAYIEEQVKDVVPVEVKDEYCFIGKWTRADNLDGVIWFYETIAPHIKKPVTINIIGKNFPEDKIICNNPMVKTNFTGFVDNPYPLIASCRAMFAPLFTGAGVKQKVFESIACGTPVIGTEIAFEGLPEKYSNMMLLANDVDSYFKAMEVDIPVEERRRIKKEFIADYTSETIPQFLNSILKK